MTDSLDQLTTIKACLDYLHAYFQANSLYYGHGTDNAWDEAVALICGVMCLPPDVSDNVLQDKVDATQRNRLLDLAQQRVEQRQPLAYLLGEAWFMGMPFYVDERVLIPRSPFAELIDQQFSPWVKDDEVKTILEIGTGSGCMAIAAATRFGDASVVAADINPQALKVAKKNLDRHHLSSRVQLVESDVYANVNGKFDIIMSNPPYVGGDEMNSLPLEYRHEPKQALWADNDGLDIVEKIIRGAAAHLSDKGILVVEVGNSQELLMDSYPQLPFVWLEFLNGGFGVFLLTKDQCLLV